MFKNLITIALRNMFRNKLFTFINLSGLAVGVACVSVIVVYITNELSYDRFHKSADNIYRIAWFGDGDSPQTRTPHPMAIGMVNDFPEVEAAVSMTPIWGPGLIKQTFTLNNPENNDWFEEQEILVVDTGFFNVFSFELLEGDKETVLNRPDVILITERMAVKYFGNDWATQGVTGKMLSYNSPQQVIEIGGVLKDPPINSHFHFDFLTSYIRLKTQDPNDPFLQWGDFGHFNYIKLKEGADAETLERKIFAWTAPHINADKESVAYFEERPNAGFQLQPLTDIHLYSNIRWELEPNGNSAYVYIMSAAAFFILIIAAFNFMNLTTAQSVKRSREIGVRKSLGAKKNQLRLQFIAETTLLAFLAVIIGGFLAEISLPFFENITGLQLNSALLYSPTFLTGFTLLILVLGITAGIYPAFFLSKVPTTKVLKGEFVSGRKGSTFRQVLVILQFSMAMLLITGSLVILNQLQFLQNKPLGFNQAKKIIIPMLDGEMQAQYPVLEERLLKLKSVQHVAAGSNIPGGQFNQQPVYAVEAPQIVIDASEVITSHDYLNLFDVPLKEGRYFSPATLTDTASAFIINEALANSLNLQNPIGKELILDKDGELLRGTVIGVTENFHYQSLHTPVRPMIVLQRKGYNHLIVDVLGNDFETDLAQIQTIWQQYAGNFQFSYEFLDSNLAAQYKAEKVTGKVFSFFSLVAVFIACLGLFSMASINMQRKQKEMGVRKVLGASTGQVLLMLLTSFSKPIIFALLLAAPLAWWIMDAWLQNFTYHIGLGLPVFLIAGTLVILIAWGTIAWLVFKTATANPVKALKIE